MQPLHETENRLGRSLGSGLWGGLNRILVCAIMGAVCLLVALLLTPIAKNDQELEGQLQELRGQIAQEQAFNKQGNRLISLLQWDTEYLKTIARDRLGVMEEGEKILRFEPEKP